VAELTADCVLGGLHEMNISSAILHVTPVHLAEARGALLAMAGVEIHAETPEGKVIVVLEDDDMESAANKYVALHGVPGVASVAMVYQYSDDESVGIEEVQA
jgi:nitrate reductase NapD